MNRAYRVAVVCGIIPLVFGVLIFVLWLITRWKWLMLAGVYAILGGIVLFIIGAISLSYYCMLGLRNPKLPSQRVFISTLAGYGILFSNIPFAIGIVVAAVAIETCYTVVVHNASPMSLDEVRVIGGGCEAEFGKIPPGKVSRRSFWIKGDGELVFRGVCGDTAYMETIDEYVTNNLGGHCKVTINPNGTASVSNKYD